jgi:hypothetical protein
VLDVLSGIETNSVAWGRSHNRSVDGEYHVRSATKWEGKTTFTWELVANGKPVANVPREHGILSTPMRCSRAGFLVGRASTIVWLGPGAAARDVATLQDEDRVLALTDDDVLLCASKGSPVLKEIPLQLP